MLKKLYNFFFVGVYLTFYLFILYGAIITNHPIALVFLLVGVVIGFMEIAYRASNYKLDKRIKIYITSGLKEC